VPAASPIAHRGHLVLSHANPRAGAERHPVTRINAEHSLVRALGVWGLAASIVNITVGGGIFRLPASAAAALGPAAPVAYVVCAIAMGLIVLCFAEAGSRVALTGGLYAYVEVAFGPLVGFVSGLMLWAGIGVATAAVASFFADALGALVPAVAAGTPRNVTLAVILFGFGALNIAGVRGASRFIAVMTVAKLLPLLLLIVVGIASVRGDALTWTTAPSTGDVARASAVLMFAFLGVESALVPSGEVHNPARTVPRAIFIAMMTVTVLYLVVQIVTQGILGASLANETTPLASAAAVVMGEFGRKLILIGSTVSMFGYLSGMILSGPRMLFAFARDGFLPPQLGLVHQRFHTPYIAIAVQTLLVTIVAIVGKFELLALVANGTILLVYAACCVAVLVLRQRDVHEEGSTPFRPPLAGAIPIFALVIIAWLLASLKAEEWKAMLVLLGVAIVVYAASLPSRRAANARGVA
jgi:APA family basic amino acid/polyamine antiporter